MKTKCGIYHIRISEGHVKSSNSGSGGGEGKGAGAASAATAARSSSSFDSGLEGRVDGNPVGDGGSLLVVYETIAGVVAAEEVLEEAKDLGLGASLIDGELSVLSGVSGRVGVRLEISVEVDVDVAAVDDLVAGRHLPDLSALLSALRADTGPAAGSLLGEDRRVFHDLGEGGDGCRR